MDNDAMAQEARKVRKVHIAMFYICYPCWALVTGFIPPDLFLVGHFPFATLPLLPDYWMQCRFARRWPKEELRLTLLDELGPLLLLCAVAPLILREAVQTWLYG